MGRPPAGPIVGLHMIVRDAEQTIERALGSLLPGVHRVVVHDTGSEDGTVALVRQLLTTWAADQPEPADPTWLVREVQWPDDFAAARQAALDDLLQFPVTHVVWADADDEVVGAEHLPAWAERIGPGSAGFMAHYAYGHDHSGNLACSHYRERLMPVAALGTWAGAIHEVLNHQPGLALGALPVPHSSQLPATNGAWPVAVDGIEWVHHPVGRTQLGRNRGILERDLAAQREAGKPDPRTLFYLAQEYAILGDMEAAEAADGGAAPEDAHQLRVHQLQRAVAMLDEYATVAGWCDEAYQAAHRKADFLRALGDYRGALDVDRANAERQPDWPDSWHGMAESYLALGQPRLALDHTSLGLARPYPMTAMILNPTDYTAQPLRLQVLALQQVGDHDGAVAAAQQLVQLSPNDALAHSMLAGTSEAANRLHVKEALLALDEALARHDENLAAYQVLRNAPYFLRNDAEVAARLVRRHQGVRHVLGEPERLGRYYGDENPHIPITRALQLDDDAPAEQQREAIVAFCGRLPRAQFVLAGLREQAAERGTPDDLSALTLLDLGCNDGWLGWWLMGEHGLGSYTGVDLNEDSLAGARALGQLWPDVDPMRADFRRHEILSFRSRRGIKYDAVVCCEVIEHVPDTDQLAEHLGRLAKRGGRVYISTPSGAYERGNVAEWDSPEPRGHVRAMRPQDVAALALDHGDLCGLHDGEDGVVAASWRPRRRLGRLDLYLGQAGGDWHPSDARTKGMGGSETMAVRMASAMADKGWRVRVYGACAPGAFAGAEYLPWWLFDPGDQRDVLVSSRFPSLVRDDPRGVRVLWLHDAEYPDLAANVAGWDEVWCVGAWQRDQLAFAALASAAANDGMVAHPDSWVVMPNGIPVAAWDYGARTFKQREPWAVYSSSPDRGLVNLLQLWPDVLDLVAEASPGTAPQLHLAYGFTSTYEAMAEHSPHLQAVRREVEDAMAMPGVVWHGTLGQAALRGLQQRARVWAYPTDFPEVSCITAMEAQAAGMAVLTTDVAELPATAGPAQLQRFPAWEQCSERDRMAYAQELAQLLVDAERWGPYHQRSREQAPRFDVTLVAEQWNDRLLQLTGRRADDTDVRTSPTDPRSEPAWTP